MKKKCIVANWKMNISPNKAGRLTEQFLSLSRASRGITTILCPSFISICSVKRIVQKQSRNDVLVGAQDCFWEDRGAYTGEESPQLLSEAGCKAVIIGHSERRRFLGETDEIIGLKLRAILSISRKLSPIICIGETLQERQGNKTSMVLKRQLIGAFKNIGALLQDCFIAYEPIWAIGTGVAILPTDCANASRIITATLRTLLPETSMKYVRILYGGSVTAQNTSEIIRYGAIDGLLIGSASLDARTLTTIRSIVEEIL